GRVLEAASPHGLTGLAGSSPLAAVDVTFLGDGGGERLHARRARPAPRAEARPRPARRPPQQLPGPRLSGRCGPPRRTAAQANGGWGETALRANGASGYGASGERQRARLGRGRSRRARAAGRSAEVLDEGVLLARLGGGAGAHDGGGAGPPVGVGGLDGARAWGDVEGRPGRGVVVHVLRPVP